MAKKKIVLTLTPAEQKLANALVAKKLEQERMSEKAADLEQEAQELEDEAYRLESEIDDDESDLVSEVEVRLELAAEAEAKKLNAANKDPKVTYEAEISGEAVIKLPNGDESWVETWKVTKDKAYDRDAALVKELKARGYTVTKAK